MGNESIYASIDENILRHGVESFVNIGLSMLPAPLKYFYLYIEQPNEKKVTTAVFCEY